MALIPSVLILFDTTALLAGKTLDWRSFTQLGECYVPEAVLEQMDYLCDRASEPDVEHTAREFKRFYTDGDWKRTGIQAEHAALKPTPGHTLSKRARLALSVASCVYGMALRYPNSLVVLITNDQPLLQKVMGLQVKNLCGMPFAALMQWARSQRRPSVIHHHLQLMRAVAATSNGAAPTKLSTHSPAMSRTASAQATSPGMTPGVYTARRQRSQMRSRYFMGLLSSLGSLIVLMVVIAIVWNLVSPASFAQLWQSLPIGGSPR